MMKTLAISGLLISATSNGALAWEAETVTERLKQLFAAQGIDLAWTGVSDDGSSITIEDLKATPADENRSVDLGTIVLEDVTEDDKNYQIGEVSLPSYESTSAKGSVSMQDISVSGLMLPKESTDDPLADVILYESANLGGLQISSQDTDVFTLSAIHVEMMPPADDGTLEFTGAADRFTLDIGAVTTQAKSRETLEKLGYSQIEGTVEMAGSWRPSDGRLMLSQNDVTVASAGKLGLTLDLSGYTPEFANALREMQAEMAANPKGDKSAQGMAMLGLMQQLTFNGVVIRFDDDSLTNKLLDHAAERQGVERADVANQVKAMVPMKAASFLGPELTASVTEALSTFLEDPESLEIRAQPESPVPFALLMGAALASPQSLAGQLGLKINANQ
ncbi:hypothetical protein [Mesorhizobium sp. J18]|uniref:hypothetical protein n=1 Tax=Mesorhizobium sp. J18 TaxID=935263 RepID=UPI0011A72556|nr:hypothetical protein [Mesorhizobium sp. J18]